MSLSEKLVDSFISAAPYLSLTAFGVGITAFIDLRSVRKSNQSLWGKFREHLEKDHGKNTQRDTDTSKLERKRDR